MILYSCPTCHLFYFFLLLLLFFFSCPLSSPVSFLLSPFRLGRSRSQRGSIDLIEINPWRHLCLFVCHLHHRFCFWNSLFKSIQKPKPAINCQLFHFSFSSSLLCNCWNDGERRYADIPFQLGFMVGLWTIIHCFLTGICHQIQTRGLESVVRLFQCHRNWFSNGGKRRWSCALRPRFLKFF